MSLSATTASAVTPSKIKRYYRHNLLKQQRHITETMQGKKQVAGIFVFLFAIALVWMHGTHK
jgi:uncharacterized membrane protein